MLVLKSKPLGLLVLCGFISVATGCVTMQPREVDNVCHLFEEKRKWYKAAKRTEKRWGVPLQIPMAIIHQESRFHAKARPPRSYVLGFIPWGYKSSAYGYAQVKTETWRMYTNATGRGGADRDDFADAIDFIGWYMDQSQKRNGVSKWDAKSQYLNYHEGWGGYARGTYHSKAWLLRVAGKVQTRASQYGAQYQRCKEELDKSWWGRLWS